MTEQFARIRAVLSAHEKEILTLPNIVGVGIGRKQKGGKQLEDLCIQIFVERKMTHEDLKKQEMTPLPSELEGIPIDVVEVGRPRLEPTRDTSNGCMMAQ